MLIPSPFYLPSSTPFVFTDTEQLFRFNCKTRKKWVWKDRLFCYQFNSLGYRMNKEVNKVDFDNYYAFFGCSHTVGIGLPLEETFAYRISESMNVDYINGAMGGASPDFVFYNFTNFISLAPKKPTVVVINWPDTVRLCVNDSSGTLRIYCPSITHDISFDKVYKIYLLEHNHQLFKLRYYQKAIQEICKSNGIHLFEFTSGQSYREQFVREFPNIPIADPYYPGDEIDVAFGRDISRENIGHFGISHQKIIIDLFNDWYRKNVN